MKREETNIYMVANEAGVSIATVSRVINQSDSVSEKSRKKVFDAIEKLNYVPNQIARGLSTSTFNGIAVVVPDAGDTFFWSLLKGITQAADELGFNVMLFDSDNNQAREHRILDSLRGLRLQGIIIVPVSCSDPVVVRKLKDFEALGVTVMLLDRELESGNFDCVISADEEGSFQAVTELIRQGHRKIAMMAGPGNISTMVKRSNGYYRALQTAGIPVQEEYICKCSLTVEAGYRAMEGLRALPEPPTAVFAQNGSITCGCWKMLLCLTPDERRKFSLIGFDDTEILGWPSNNISVVKRDVFQMGYETMEQIARRVRAGKKHGRFVLEVPANLVLRGSERFWQLE